MNEQSNITLGTLFHTWQTYILRLMMTIPQDGIAELEGRERRKRSGAGVIVWVITGLIITLALASITNLSDRAYAHKAGFSANVVGIGLALLVPVGVHVAVKINGAFAKLFVWSMAAMFAFISGAIQYQIYAPAGPFGWTKDHLEALAFGAGVPVAECMLAAILAVVVAQANREADSRKAQQSAEADAEHEREIAEQLRLQQIEDERERRRIEDEHRRQMEMAEAEAKRQMARLKLEAKLSNSASNSTVSTSRQSEKPSDKLSKKDALDKMIEIYRHNPDATLREVGEKIGRSKDTVSNYLKELQERSAVYVNGSVNVQ